MSHTFTPIQIAWLESLESGQLLQGSAALTNLIDGREYHCCLGVACVVFNKTPGFSPLAVKINAENKDVTYEDCTSYAPTRVFEALNLFTWKGDFRSPVSKVLSNGETAKYRCLAEMNDGGMSFAEIAAYIRANPDNVFKS